MTLHDMVIFRPERRTIRTQDADRRALNLPCSTWEMVARSDRSPSLSAPAKDIVILFCFHSIGSCSFRRVLFEIILHHIVLCFL